MSAPTLAIYRSHDRELLFHGDLEAGLARGIRIAKDLSYVRLDGRKLKVVNRDLPLNGDVSLWVVA